MLWLGVLRQAVDDFLRLDSALPVYETLWIGRGLFSSDREPGESMPTFHTNAVNRPNENLPLRLENDDTHIAATLGAFSR